MKKFLSFCLMTLLAIQVAFAEGGSTPSVSGSTNLNVETGGGNNKATDETQTRDGGLNDGDKKIITSQKYVDDELAKKQNKIGTQTGTYAVTYTNTAGTVTPRQVKTSLGTNTSDSALPTVSAVNAGLDLKQTKVPKRNENIIVTYTGTEGSIGEKYIYQSDGMYENQRNDVIEAGAFNAAVKTGLDSEFLCAGNSSSGDCWLWSIHNETAYVSTTGTIVQNGTPTPTSPVEPTFLQQGNMILRSVSNYSDSYDLETGKITRRVGVKVLDGTENWSFNTSWNTFIYNPTNMLSAQNATVKIYSTHFTQVPYSPTTVDGIGYIFYTSIFIRQTQYNGDTAAFKQWLASQYAAGTPVTVYYPLATAVEEDMKVSYTTLVPDGYTPIEYIQTSGTQWIDTGIVGKNGVSVDAVFMLNTTDNGSLFGNRMTGNTRFWPAMWFTSGGVLRWNSAIATDTMVGTVQANKLYKTKFVSSSSGWTFDVNGERVSSGTTTVANTNNMYLFGTNNNNSTTLQYPFKGKMYSAQVYQGGTLVRDYIPAKQGTVVGVYDKVSDTFFTNQGSGTFTAGPDISNIVYIPQAD